MIQLTNEEITFPVKSRYNKGVVLRVWKDRLHAPVNPDNTIVIYMRLGHPQYSVTFDKEHYYYIDKNPVLDKILELGNFIFSIDKEEEIIKLLEQL